MVYINKVYTKFGDAGDTMLASGATTSKRSLRVEAYGSVDELNATVGLVRLELGRDLDGDADSKAAAFTVETDRRLARIQQELFDLGAELSEPGAVDGKARLRIEDADIEALERSIDALNESLEPLRSFVLPGGGPTGTAAHIARTVCRRAERRVVSLMQDEPVRGQALRYLNRLSDYFFVLGRAAAQTFGHDEVLWDQDRKRD